MPGTRRVHSGIAVCIDGTTHHAIWTEGEPVPKWVIENPGDEPFSLGPVREAPRARSLVSGFAARPWLWLPAPGISAANTLAPYYCPATVIGVLVDQIEIEFDQPVTEVWPQRQMVAPADLHPWPHHCRQCRATAAPLDPATDIAALRRRCAALEAERDALQAELFATRAALQVPA